MYRSFPVLFESLPSYRIWAARQRALASLSVPLSGRVPRPWVAPLPVRIEFPAPRSPRVSVIIPVFGQRELTMRCLASIERNPPDLAFEVIVVDDASPDDTLEHLANVDGITVIRHYTNEGFISACNRGAAAATGEFLCFLNNDTEVASAWLDELVAAFGCFPQVGLVGSALVYPDGRLQEAGCILWRDGGAWNLGRGCDPADPRFGYARVVDYCSAASLVVRRQTFLDAGGFDPHFAPAYAEDADLALRLRARGLLCVCQPLSLVIHHEGASSAFSADGGPKRLQTEHLELLRARWHSRLASHPLPGQGDPADLLDPSLRGRVLVLDQGTPLPDRDAGAVATFNLMLMLRDAGYQVTFAPVDDMAFVGDGTQALQRSGIETLYAPFVQNVRAHLRSHGNRYDLVVAVRPDVTERCIPDLRRYCTRAQVLYLSPDLHFLRLAREAEITGGESAQDASERMRVRELALMSAVDGVVVHTDVERDLLQSLLPAVRISVLPWVIGTGGPAASPEMRSNIVFLGNYQHEPNVDAVTHFVNAMLPSIHAQAPGLKFVVAGAEPPASMRALSSAAVEVTGHVTDLPTLLSRARVMVAPLRFGAGVKGKVVTALAAGVPVVATPLAIEGIPITPGIHVLVEESPEAFAGAVVRLFRDDALWMQLSVAGREAACRLYGEPAAERALRNMLAELECGLPQGPFVRELFSPLKRRRPLAGAHAPDAVLPRAPLAVVRDATAHAMALDADEAVRALAQAHMLCVEANAESFTIEGFCAPCGRSVRFIVDGIAGAGMVQGVLQPNWRERLECPLCRMNNRQRLMAMLLARDAVSLQSGEPVYLMEQITPLFEWASRSQGTGRVIGSEYLGAGHAPGVMRNGVRHEDARQLSFADGSLGLVVSNDVFEHVSEPLEAFRECARVLRRGGMLLFTVPFDAASAASKVRATVDAGGNVRHLLPAVYHGDPQSAEGSLVYTDFGWDLLSMLLESGFDDAWAELWLDPPRGHVGPPQIVFRATTRPSGRLSA